MLDRAAAAGWHLGDSAARGWAMHQLGTLALCYEDYGQARELLEQALSERRTAKDKDGADVSKWKRVKPDGKDLDTTKVQDALFLVGGVEVQEFVDKPAGPETYGLDRPVLKVTIREKDKPEASFEVGEKGGTYYARRAGDQAVLKLDATKASDLVKKFGEL